MSIATTDNVDPFGFMTVKSERDLPETHREDGRFRFGGSAIPQETVTLSVSGTSVSFKAIGICVVHTETLGNMYAENLIHTQYPSQMILAAMEAAYRLGFDAGKKERNKHDDSKSSGSIR